MRGSCCCKRPGAKEEKRTGNVPRVFLHLPHGIPMAHAAHRAHTFFLAALASQVNFRSKFLVSFCFASGKGFKSGTSDGAKSDEAHEKSQNGPARSRAVIHATDAGKFFGFCAPPGLSTNAGVLGGGRIISARPRAPRHQPPQGNGRYPRHPRARSCLLRRRWVTPGSSRGAGLSGGGGGVGKGARGRRTGEEREGERGREREGERERERERTRRRTGGVRLPPYGSDDPRLHSPRLNGRFLALALQYEYTPSTSPWTSRRVSLKPVVASRRRNDARSSGVVPA